MKIEIGESLVYSWLRHIKNCQIVQLNWKTSPKWHRAEINLDSIKSEIEEKFKDPAFDIFHKNSGVDQLLKQAEIDVVGVSYDPNKEERTYYFVDVAFHENGVNYGINEETISRILKKFIRSYFLYLSYFKDSSSAVFYFVTPKMSELIFEPLILSLIKLEEIFNNHGWHPNFQLLVNDDFKNEILTPTMASVSEIADTNELFLRSAKLWKMFSYSPDKKPKAIDVDKKMPTESTIPKIKIGLYVRNCLDQLIKKEKIDEAMVKNLLDKSYCHEKFGSQFPFLRKIAEGRNDENGYPRYYSEPWKIKGSEYFLSSQWYEYQRTKFEEWYKGVMS